MSKIDLSEIPTPELEARVAEIVAELRRREQLQAPGLAWFYGVWPGTRAGHYLRRSDGSRAHGYGAAPPEWPERLRERDGWLYPWKTSYSYGDPNRGREQVQGQAVMEVYQATPRGFTYLGFWDRSEDNRGGCCSSFVLEGVYTFGGACERLRELFPEVWARFPFEVVLGE